MPFSPTSPLNKWMRCFASGVVGYGVWPAEVIGRIRAREFPTIMGNYDDGVGFDRDECGCACREESERERGDRSLA